MISKEELEGMEIEDFVGVYTVCIWGDGSISWVLRNDWVDSEKDLLGGTCVWGDVRWYWYRRFEENLLHFRTLEEILEYYGEGEALSIVEGFL